MSRSSRNSERSSRNDFYRGNDKPERSLFNPQSDHPIAFNKSVDNEQPRRISKTSSDRSPPVDNEQPSRISKTLKEPSDRPRRGVLWDPNSSPPVALEPAVKETTMMDEHRSRLKVLLNRIQKAQSRVSTVQAKARSHSYFLGIHQDEAADKQDDTYSRTTERTHDDRVTHPWLAMNTDEQWKTADELWQEKMKVHHQLALAYLAVIQYDDGFAEKKNLTSLCWKRAIYSLVDEFRRAFARHASLSRWTNDTTEVPVVTDTGMTLVTFDDDGDDRQQILDTHLKRLVAWIQDFLTIADGFYQQTMAILYSLDGVDLETMEDSVRHWRRQQQRWKWYQCIGYRGDLARYRFIYTQQKQHYELAWRWYTLGTWLMPGTGRFYFFQSLLLNNSPLYYSPPNEMHKLYFNVRSLIVRRNGFVNAREGLVALFENNRQWSNTNTANIKSSVPGLFIRLHGMLFTKIDFDMFATTRRHYFDALFTMKKTTGQPTGALFSCQHLFWMETALLNIASLYSYDYAASPLAKTGDSEVETLDDSVLFGHAIDLVCQVLVELLSRYMKDEGIKSPSLPMLPAVSLSIKANENLLFGSGADDASTTEDGNDDNTQPWLVYIHIVLYWIVVTGIGVRQSNGKSIWERIIGDKITRTFWTLIAGFLTRTLADLPETTKYPLIDRHLLAEVAWSDDYLLQWLGPDPVLPEDEYLRGLGWMDDVFTTTTNHTTKKALTSTVDRTLVDMTRRMRILDFGFTLVKQQVLEYDPVQETFTQETALEMLPILTALDDAVLFDSTIPLEDEMALETIHTEPVSESDDDEDAMMGQLKKRRQQLQSMLATMTQEQKHADTFGYSKLVRGKERQVRLDRIRTKVIPGQTVLVLDTNCFIGHMDAIQRLIQSGVWSIVIPLVVITELDGLKGNAPPLGTVADKALTLIETSLASTKRLIRIQTSHHNFMYDISIRSEQFIFGETDKNLDDLILSTCLWWKKSKTCQEPVVPVCLVTADRNLSVKARARDVQVIPVSGLMEITP